MFPDSVSGLFYLGGNFKWTGTDTVYGFCSWDGFKFTPLGKPIDTCGGWDCNPILMFNRYRDGICVGVEDSIGSIPAKGIAKWDGTGWSPLGLGLSNETSYGRPLGSCVQDDKLYVVGQFLNAGNEVSNSTAYWDGDSWHSLGFPADADSRYPHNYCCIFYKDELYVGGNCSNIIDGNYNRCIARFDGTKWKQVGSGLFGGFADVRDMEVYKGELYVCGNFRSSDGNAGNKIMRWDGEQWKDVGGGLCAPNNIAEGMAIHDGKLYVVGIFDCVGNGLPARDIAAWDGERWCSLGRSKIDNKIVEVASWNNDLYIGGGFTEIDGQPVKHFAKWVGNHATDTCSAPVVSAPEQPGNRSVLVLRPNPASDVLRVALPKTAATVRVYDLAGRDISGKTGNWNVGEVQNLADVYGSPEVELEVEALPPGWYLLQVIFRDGSSAAAGFVKM